MSFNTFGKIFTFTTFGESHGKAIGCIIDGCPSNLALSEADLQKELDRRRPGQSGVTTARKESDRVEILSGVFEGKTLGTPIALLIRNEDARSKDYDALKEVFRPGHADYAYLQKFGLVDHRGGGRSSGRETAARVAAGAVAKKLLALQGIRVIAFTRAVAGIEAQATDLAAIEANPVRCPDPAAAKRMEEAILAAKAAGDSLGGIVEIQVKGCPAGLGEPVFGKLDAELAKALMSLPAVKGVEVGAGFAATRLKGSENNDSYTASEDDQPVPATNRAGGVLGGISSGEEIIARIAVKPPSSIALPQKTVDHAGRETEIAIQGRHDPCLCPRVVPVAEAMAALVLVDALMMQKARQW